jgi:hypothetical protein
MNRDPTLCRSFVRQAREALSHFPQVKHTWSIDEDEDHCILDIPEECDSGFPITVEVYPDEIMVIAGRAHMNLDLDGEADVLAARTLGLVRDLLSPAMRIRERLAAGKPYKWAFEFCQDGKWITEEWIGLFFYNYFGKKTEKIYLNRILPAREDPFEQDAQSDGEDAAD